MATIDILIAVDAGLLATAINDKRISPGTQKQPTPLPPYSQSGIPVCMMTHDNIMSNMNDIDDWIVDANSGDTLEWQMAAFDNASDYTAYTYSAVFNPATAMSAVKYIAPQITAYLPPAGLPTGTLEAFREQVYYAECTVLKNNITIQGAISFALVDNSTKKIIGYFTLAAFVQVS